ncbi:MAG: tripartite tricarboxylate transporter substrate binding protein [Burkholderiales bacterium]|nr:tripartite tricarboxylate transporter substrate binding protein [Burkholderiales bacterium]
MKQAFLERIVVPRLRRNSFPLLVAILLTAGANGAMGQSFPTRPITLVVGSEPGSAPDIIGRIVGGKIAESIGQSVVIENRPGAVGTIAATQVARAKPDGYTLFVGSVSTHPISKALRPDLAYDPERSFTPIGHVASVPLVFVTSPSLGVRTITELSALARSRSGALNYSSPGSGGPQHLTAELFKSRAKLDIVHVPFKSGGAAVTALLGGEVQLSVVGMPPALAQVKAGKLVALAVTTGRRSALAPDVPTVAEAGLSGFEADNWHAMFAPAALPGPVQELLSAHLARALANPEVQQQLMRSGAEARFMPPADLATLLREETAKWGSVVRSSGIKLD